MGQRQCHYHFDAIALGTYLELKKEKAGKVANTLCSRCQNAMWTVFQSTTGREGGSENNANLTGITGFCDALKVAVWDESASERSVTRMVIECSGVLPLQSVNVPAAVEAVPVALLPVAESVGGMPVFR